MSTDKQYQRKIAVVTGTRAEYGLLRGLLDEIELDQDLQLQLIVTGMHLSPEFGLTYRDIEKDHFHIDAKVEMLLSSDTSVGVAKSVGVGIFGFTDAFERLKPDIIVVLGDRFEILAAAQTAMIMKIPVAHIHGGELTQGAIDDSIRHAITKMSHLHFAAAEVYRSRIIQMGEDPKLTFNVGALGIERIKKMTLLNQNSLEKTLNFKIKKPLFLFTYHPETINLSSVQKNMNHIFSALDCFPQATIIMTKSNADEAGRFINQQLALYESENASRVKLVTNMGDLNYLSTLKLADVVIGNSSSGISEAPSLKIPTVNIGSRQAGRLRADSIIDCDANQYSIQSAIRRALSDEFKNIVHNTTASYNDSETAIIIKNKLKNINMEKITKKKFYDFVGYEK